MYIRYEKMARKLYKVYKGCFTTQNLCKQMTVLSSNRQKKKVYSEILVAYSCAVGLEGSCQNPQIDTCFFFVWYIFNVNCGL